MAAGRTRLFMSITDESRSVPAAHSKVCCGDWAVAGSRAYMVELLIIICDSRYSCKICNPRTDFRACRYFQKDRADVNTAPPVQDSTVRMHELGSKLTRSSLTLFARFLAPMQETLMKEFLQNFCAAVTDHPGGTSRGG